MRTPFARRNITHRKARAAVALAGVCFSVLLVFMQTGFYNAIMTAAGYLYRAVDADIFVVSNVYESIAQAGTIPRERLAQARAVEGVEDASGMLIGLPLWRNPQTRLRDPILLMGIDPDRYPFRLSRDLAPQLANGAILVDALSRPRFGRPRSGMVTEVADVQVHVVGVYTMGGGFVADGTAITDDDTFVRIVPGRSVSSPTLGLVRVRRGADLQAVIAGLRARYPQDVEVFTRAEMIAREENYWAVYTSVGPVFGLGSALGLVIGVVILYQVMVTDMATHIAEYATLKALGYGNARLRWIVLQEATIFSVAGFVSGWLLSIQLYRVVGQLSGLAMELSAERAFAVFLLTLLMCWTAGLLSTRQLAKADPADLF